MDSRQEYKSREEVDLIVPPGPEAFAAELQKLEPEQVRGRCYDLEWTSCALRNALAHAYAWVMEGQARLRSAGLELETLRRVGLEAAEGLRQARARVHELEAQLARLQQLLKEAQRGRPRRKCADA